MDMMTFASYRFKPSDVIEGLNRYFAETKANRYFRVPLTIRNGVWTGNPDYRKDVVFTNNPPINITDKYCFHWKYYLICDPEEVVGVAINWLREEHDIFYTPGMEAPAEDFDVNEAAKEYEKATRTSDIFCEEKLDVVPVSRVREALGIAEDSDIFECIKYRNHQLETLRIEVAVARRQHRRAIEERDQFGKRLADIRKAAGMSDLNSMDLVEYIRDLVKSRRESLDRWYDEHSTVLDMKDEILKVYREIFDCSNGDPEGTDAETLQDILTEYKRCLELKNVAEEKTIKYKELARENEEKLEREKERTKRLEQKLIEIQDICER